MGRSIRRIGAGCVGILAGLALAATPALADSSAPASYQPGGPLSAPTQTAASPDILAESAYFGGYDVVPPEGISSAGSTFKLPKFTCPVTGVAQLAGFGEWVNGAGGDLYQEGGATDALAVGSIVCNFGEPEYEINAFTINGGEFDDNTDVSQGDVIQTRVEELPSGDVLASTTDLTSGQEVSSEGASAGDDEQIYEGFVPDVYSETLENSISIPKFKSVQLSRSQIGGLHLAQVDPVITDLNQNGPVMVAPSTIAAKHPSAFTLTEKSDQ